MAGGLVKQICFNRNAKLVVRVLTTINTRFQSGNLTQNTGKVESSLKIENIGKMGLFVGVCPKIFFSLAPLDIPRLILTDLSILAMKNGFTPLVNLLKQVLNHSHLYVKATFKWRKKLCSEICWKKYKKNRKTQKVRGKSGNCGSPKKWEP